MVRGGFSSYEEEIWSRHEKIIQSLGSYEQITAWLTSDGKGNQIRKQSVAIREIAKNLAAPYELMENASSPGIDINRLRSLRIEANDIIVPEQREEAQTTIQGYIDEYERVEAERVEAEEQEERERRDILSERAAARREYQEARTAREKREAEAELRALPGGAQSLGQLKGVQTRRTRAAFRAVTA